MAAKRRPTARYRPGSGQALIAPGLLKRPTPPTSPPPGSYDPAIDAQVGQTNRGLGDYLSDHIRDFGEPGTALGGRTGEDYTLGKAGIERGAGRSLVDLLTGRTRAQEDYGQSIAGLDRSFAQQGAAQTQTARAAGVQRGGALAQAMAKRNENKAIARQPIDTGFARFNQDSSQAETRLNEDKGLALGDLDRGFLRGTDDAGIALARAQRENTQFGLDANAQRFYQANLPLGGAPAPAAKPRTSKVKRRPTRGTNRGVR